MERVGVVKSVSIILPTLNRYALLTDLLTSIRQLRRQPDEVIVIDQSRHVTGQHDYLDLVSINAKVKHLHVDFVGPCRSRNYGAALARGELLWFLDDDMVLNDVPEPIEYIQTHFEQFPNSVLMPMVEGSVQRGPVWDGRFFPQLQFASRFVESVDELRFSLAIGSGAVIVPKDLFRALAGFDERFDPNGAYEDRDLGIRCYYAGINVFQSKVFTVKHLGASSGGRRQDTVSSAQSQNTYKFWGKYLDEDLFYIQAFSYWLSGHGRGQRLLMPLIRQFLKRYLRVPNYRHLQHEVGQQPAAAPETSCLRDEQ
jgi:GT2 family glycosyltransferase